MNFALRSTISRWRGISRIRPGYPICVAAGKLAHFFIADPVSSLAGASVASTFSYWTDATRVGRFPAVHADRGLVGVALSRAVPASGGSRRSTCRARRRQCIAFVPSRRRTREGPARSPLWTGSRRSIQPRSFIQTPCDATRCSGPTPCVVLLARRRNEIGTKSDADRGQFRDAIEKGHAVLTTNPRLCGLDGVKVASFRGDAGIHNKHHLEFIFKSDEQG